MTKITSYAGALAGKVEEFRKLGQKEAMKHRPPTDATYPDAHEVELRTDAERWIASEQALFNDQVADADRSALDVRQKVRQLEAGTELALGDDTLVSEVDALLAAERAGLLAATEQRIAAEVDWRGFRSINNISSMPSYPESSIWHWSVVLALTLVETVANAFFYENAQGLVGGFFVAAIVAVVNMGSAAGLGRQFRSKNLQAKDQQILGWVCLPLFAPLTLFCNALFASFRSTYQFLQDPSDPVQLAAAFREAWTEAFRIFTLDLQFGDLNSFLLFMTGIGLSIVAYWKGYTSDDPYPGHSHLDRRLKAAQTAETQLQDRVCQRLKEAMVGRRSHVQGLASQPVALVSLLHGQTNQVEHAERTLAANAGAVERDYHLVLDAYRQANLAVRGIEPPSYFGERPAVANKICPDAAEATLDVLKQTTVSVQEFQARYKEPLNAKLNALQERMTSILSDTFPKFLGDIETEAKVRVQRGIMIMPGSVI